MIELFICAVIAVFGASVTALVQQRFSSYERRYLWYGYIAYLAAAIGKIWLVAHYFGGGDMFRYEMTSLELVHLMRSDFGVYGPEVIRLFFHQETITGLTVRGYESSTASMVAILAFAFYVLGDSLHAASTLFGVFSFFSSVAFYSAFRGVFPRRFRPALLWATLLLPSIVYWTGGFSKELFAVAGLGILACGLYLFFVRPGGQVRGIVMILVGGMFVMLFKAFILIACAAGIAAYYYVSRQQRVGSGPSARTPVYLAIAICIAVGGLLIVGEYFPRFSVDHMGEEMAEHQELGQRGGSATEVGDPTERSLAGQLAFAPLALLNSLFRPFLFEVHNAVALANALEMTVLLVLLILALKRLGVTRSAKIIYRSPTLFACSVMTVILGVGVGLATPNIGTLSRYRSPMMPFWIVIIGVLYTLSTTSARTFTRNPNSANNSSSSS